MTKTQANEPGFVLDAAAKAIYECKGLHLSTGRPWESATAADRYYCLEYAGAALAAAPSVPSPAYGGVKALEDFLRDARSWLDSRVDNARPGWMVAKIEAAEAALSCLSPEAVEEADAKAGKPMAFLVHNPIVDNIVRERESLFPASRESDAREFAKLLRADCTLLYAAAPSTPSPQIGKAGAGPVGEAVLEAAWQAFGDCPVDMCGDHDTEQRKCVDAAVIAAFSARPVEEPGEVERLVEETGSSSVDDLRDMALVGHSLMNAIHHATKEGPYKDWTPAEDPAEIVSDLINDLEEAQAKAERRVRERDTIEEAFVAACTELGCEPDNEAALIAAHGLRERLEKQEAHTFRVVAENDKLRELADAAEELLEVSNLRGETAYLDPCADPGLWTSRRNEAWSALEIAIAARAALTGDAQEARDNETYEIGKRDGYEEAVQHIDERTGGDGEYVAVVGYDGDDRNCPDAPSMVAKIVRRFEAVEHRAETAETALAETRERLEKEEAENAARLRRAVNSAAAEWCGEKDRETFPEDILYFKNNWRALPGLRNRVELHLGRAALTGDAQEAGR